MRAGHETGEDNVHIYREAAGADGQMVYSSRHSSSEAAGPLDEQPILAAYPPLEGLQQKRLAARRHKTTYAYDFPSVFGNALRELWTARAVAGEPGTAPKGAAQRPGCLRAIGRCHAVLSRLKDRLLLAQAMARCRVHAQGGSLRWRSW